ncbi:MAG TPA: hypothetical protein VGF55_22305 [Gemmataceae bacterium]|jgi:hypothetical protein
MKVERKTVTETIPLVPEAQAKPFEKPLTPHHGYHVVEAKLAGKQPAGVRNVAVQVSPDHTAVKVTGELLPATAKPGQAGQAMVAVPVAITVEKQSAGGRKPAGSTATLAVPGTTTVPLAAMPADWVNAKRQATLELRYGTQKILPPVPLPYRSPLTVGSKQYTLEATVAGDQVRIDVR